MKIRLWGCKTIASLKGVSLCSAVKFTELQFDRRRVSTGFNTDDGLREVYCRPGMSA